MGSREDGTPHQPLLSSLVVRPSDSGGGGGGGGGGSDYEPGEVRRDRPPYSRSERYSADPGYRTRAASGSPVRRRDVGRRYSPELDRLDDIPRHRGFGGARDNFRPPARYRDYSPRSRGRGGRPFGRGFGAPGYGPGPFRGGEGMHRTKPNVRPREGDWYCPDPTCGNLNFARREYCNNCRRHQYSAVGSPRRGYGGPPPPMGPPRRIPGPPMERSPGRFLNGFRSPPPRGWPRDFGPGGPPPPRHEARFSDHMRRDRFDYAEEDYRDRAKFERLPPPDWAPRDRPRDNFLDRKGYDRRPVSPLPAPPPSRGRWADRDIRERSRSPIRGGPSPPPKDFRRDSYMERGRDDRRGVGPERIANVY